MRTCFVTTPISMSTQYLMTWKIQTSLNRCRKQSEASHSHDIFSKETSLRLLRQFSCNIRLLCVWY